MGISCIVDSIAGKMGLVDEQNFTNQIGFRFHPATQFQLATHVRRFKMLIALNVVWIAHKVNTREELLQRLLSAARSINNAAVLRSLTTRVRKFIKAGGGRFEHLV